VALWRPEQLVVEYLGPSDAEGCAPIISRPDPAEISGLRPLVIGSELARQLVSYLALRPGQVVLRETLVGSLFGQNRRRYDSAVRGLETALGEAGAPGKWLRTYSRVAPSQIGRGRIALENVFCDVLELIRAMEKQQWAVIGQLARHAERQRGATDLMPCRAARYRNGLKREVQQALRAAPEDVETSDPLIATALVDCSGGAINGSGDARFASLCAGCAGAASAFGAGELDIRLYGPWVAQSGVLTEAGQLAQQAVFAWGPRRLAGVAVRPQLARGLAEAPDQEFGGDERDLGWPEMMLARDLEYYAHVVRTPLVVMTSRSSLVPPLFGVARARNVPIVVLGLSETAPGAEYLRDVGVLFGPASENGVRPC
jgi:hypothetical protein